MKPGNERGGIDEKVICRWTRIPIHFRFIHSPLVHAPKNPVQISGGRRGPQTLSLTDGRLVLVLFERFQDGGCNLRRRYSPVLLSAPFPRPPVQLGVDRRWYYLEDFDRGVLQLMSQGDAE